MFKILLSLFLYHKLNKVYLINHLCLDDYIPKNNDTLNDNNRLNNNNNILEDNNIPKNTNNNRFGNLILLNTNKTYIRINKIGYDERFNDKEAYDLEKIIINFNKYKLLNILEDTTINVYNKLDIINNDDDLSKLIKDSSYSSIKIKNGGLFNDWNIEFN